MDYIKKAYGIVKNAHAGQKDKAGKDYFLHPCTVADMVSDDNAKVVALLHDVVEDTGVSLKDLRDEGFPEEIIDAVDAITKRSGETYNDYISRVKMNKLAKTVKIADMTHNSDITRFSNPSEKDFERVKKYKVKIEELIHS